MRTPLGVSLLTVTACGGGSSEPERGAFDVDRAVVTTDREVRIDVHRREVPLRELPMERWLAGLPMDGLADVDLALAAPVVDGAPQLSRAHGTFALACAKGCTLGDDRARLRVLPELAPEGIPFEHLRFDAIEIRGSVGDGHAKLTAWKLSSPDLQITAAIDVTLRDDLASSPIDGCVRFAATDALRERAPRMHALIETTGAPRDADGMFSIKLAGTLGTMKRLGQRCGG